MNKQELKYKLNQLPLNKEEYCLIAGSSLVMHGIKDTTEDIDLYVSNEGMEKLKQKYKMKKSTKPYQNLYEVTNDLEVTLIELKNQKIYTIEGIPCHSFLEEYKWKKEKNRTKDKETIKKMEEKLKEIAEAYHCEIADLKDEMIEEYLIRNVAIK